MKRALLVVAAGVMVAAAMALAMTPDDGASKVRGVTPEQVRWFTPSYYHDGRQRAQLLGDSGQGGTWIDRVKIPGGGRVPAHTHPQDELVTVMEGTWYLGEGEKYDPARLKGYPAGSFIVIPHGVPHFVAATDGPVIVQLSDVGKFETDFLEKSAQ